MENFYSEAAGDAITVQGSSLTAAKQAKDKAIEEGKKANIEKDVAILNPAVVNLDLTLLSLIFRVNIVLELRVTQQLTLV